MHLEAKFHEFNQNGGTLKRFLVDVSHWVDFSTLRMISVHNEKEQRAIQRGKKGVRGKRPTPERFLDSAGIDMRKFRATTKDWDGSCGKWLGREYMKWRKRRLYTVQDVIEGIKKQ